MRAVSEATEPAPTRGKVPDRNLALELVRVTEAAALAAARWIGRGEKESADQAAVDAMRGTLDTVVMRGVVVIGEGEKDEAPMLFNGESVGDGYGPGGGRRGRPAGGHAADGVRPAQRDHRDRARRARDDVLPRRGALHEQDRGRPGGAGRDRHHRLADRRTCRRWRRRSARRRATSTSSCWSGSGTRSSSPSCAQAGARVNLIRDGDVAPSIAAARPGSGVDMLYGIGGTPEGVISAAALKCLGGGIQGQLWPRDDDERQALRRRRARPGARAARPTISWPATTSSSRRRA